MKLVIVEAKVRLMVEVRDEDNMESIAKLRNAEGYSKEGCFLCWLNLYRSFNEGHPRLVNVRYVRDATEGDRELFTQGFAGAVQ